MLLTVMLFDYFWSVEQKHPPTAIMTLGSDIFFHRVKYFKPLFLEILMIMA